jgi:hypothetical protein
MLMAVGGVVLDLWMGEPRHTLVLVERFFSFSLFVFVRYTLQQFALLYSPLWVR